ncbi:hypothetical protein SAMN05421730_10654 [Anaerobium acetethylicum]|uniref:Uncharacterized protein n=2 Tax=Anaerobium acetethylicum TaxID=1619234 RepID=A0A1D3TZ85_9FIRM|nr:hypothetical protein SAMN05421730_10654 [Anaerobium acetethylicum]
MEMCYDGALVMPSSYAVMNEEEMTYVEGGADFSRSWVSVIVDVAALAVCPYLAPIKYMGKAAAIALVKVYLPKLAGAFKTIIQMAIGASINITTGAIGNLLLGNAWSLTSVGGMVALAADFFSDGMVDTRVRF